MRVIRTPLISSGLAMAIASLTLLPIAAEGDARLAEAAKHRDAAGVRHLLAERVAVNQPQPDGATALHWAAYWNDVETADRLIRAGANVNAVNDLGVTPLALASAHETVAMVTRLLAAGANAGAASVSGESPLMVAARTGRLDAAKALLAHGADVNAKEKAHDQTALMWAAVNRHPDVVKALIDAGADVDARSRVRRRKVFLKTSRSGSYDVGAYERHVEDGDIVDVDEGGYTALLFAAQQGDRESARLLLGAHADVNTTAPIGMSALVVAVYSNQTDAALTLLDAGADADAAGAGYTALHAAVLRGNLTLVTALLAHGANPNPVVTRATGARRQSADFALGDTLVGATPVYLAAKFGEIAMLHALADTGGQFQFAMPDGSTPIMAAMETSRINSLTDEGLGVDRRGRLVFFRLLNTPSPQAVENDVLEMITLAVSHGADVNAIDSDGDTALHAAAASGMNRVVDVLAKSGARLDARNKRGRTPLAVADAPRRNRGGDVFQGHADTAALLRSLGARE